MAPPAGLFDLVERFERNRPSYLSGHYNETQVRREFIDPFFELLDWDVGNRKGASEAYKDVVHEDAIKVGGGHKAPDYGFRIGGTRKFFVEAKKPSVNLRDDFTPAFQLRRYAWSARLPISILTDFEEFAVYDCRIKPDKNDKPTTARVAFFKYDQYADRWEEISSIFSKESLLSGSFDQFAESMATKRGTDTVDAAFLQEIEFWRNILARTLALQNRTLTQRQLNFAVQMTIDRIIFLRMAEDRGIEEYGRLRNVANGPGVYDRLCEVYRRADERYNSGLFHFGKESGRAEQHDALTPNLEIDDQPLRDIIEGLYYPESPYEFSVLPVEVLGQVYEQFLGKVIRLSPDRLVSVEEKPEVRKAGGVYYTPTFIVDYIVKNTVGKLLEGKTPGSRAVKALKIVDPACGSGSFLLGAYQYLLDWHRDQYVGAGPERYRNALNQGPGGQWLLTTREKKRILLNCIFGVDIDPQAVEVTKLSLLLKVLEGESEQALATQLRFFQERALPDLGNNIKCGNSLIGPDFYDSGQLSLLDEEAHYRLNVFDWTSSFPDVFFDKNHGFNAVIGNPPYIFGEYHDKNTKDYFQKSFELAKNQYDTYWLFIEQGLRLTANRGRFGMIVPDAVLARDVAKGARELLLSDGLEKVYHCGLVFQAGVSAAVLVVAKGEQPKHLTSEVRKGTDATVEHVCTRERFLLDSERRLLVHASDDEARLLARMQTEGSPLETFVRISRGEEIGKAAVHGRGPIPILAGEDIARYQFRPPSRFVQKVTKSPALYNSPKILIVKTGSRCIAALDVANTVTMQSIYNVHIIDSAIQPEAILAILNSKLTGFFIAKTFTAYKLLFPQLNQTTVQSIPVPADIHCQQDALARLVSRMLSLQARQAEAKTGFDQDILQQQIDATDRLIDRLVYESFRLTDEEISIVEQTI